MSKKAHQNNILRELPLRHLSQLMNSAEPLSISRGEVLFREGESGDSCYWVVEGVLKVSVNSDNGAERVFALLGPGAVIGELAILDGRPRSATATAFSDARLTVLKRAVLRNYLDNHPSVWADLVSVLVRRIRDTNKALFADTFLSLDARVAKAILDLCDQVGEPGDAPDFFHLPAAVSQQDIAGMAGVARESVSRVLSKWQRRGMVVRQRGKLLKLKRSMLEYEAGPS